MKAIDLTTWTLQKCSESEYKSVPKEGLEERNGEWYKNETLVGYFVFGLFGVEYFWLQPDGNAKTVLFLNSLLESK
jgi:hypothetical protein